MNCEKIRELLESFVNGTLSVEDSREVREHLVSCRDCASSLSASEWVEVLPVLEERIEVSGEFPARLRAGLEERIHSRTTGGRLAAFRGTGVAALGWPKTLAVAGTLAALVVAGIFLGRFPERATDLPAAYGNLGVAENLPLLEDMAVINHLELLEDFDAIENLPDARN